MRSGNSVRQPVRVPFVDPASPQPRQRGFSASGRCWQHAAYVCCVNLILMLVAMLGAFVGADAAASDAAGGKHFQTTRGFTLGSGRAVRSFTFRERSGVILLNRIMAPVGVKAYVDARIPDLAGAKVWSWRRANDPALGCRRSGAVEVCVQGEEWCPMPQASWHFRLVKLSGPPGRIRVDYVVAPPPSR